MIDVAGEEEWIAAVDDDASLVLLVEKMES